MADGDVEAVVFDLDGVLVDSEQLWDEVQRDLAAEAGRPWRAGATSAMLGMSTAEWSAYLVDEVGSRPAGGLGGGSHRPDGGSLPLAAAPAP